jgi:mRNA interferase YafQ
MLKVEIKNQFKKDVEKSISSNKDMEKLKEIMLLLVDEKRIPPKNRDHKLQGSYKDRRECHLEPDWLIIYKIDQESGTIIFERTGSHSELFK